MDINMTRIAIAGATGRMGRAIIELASGDDRLEIAAALTCRDDPLCGGTLRVADLEVRPTATLEAAADVLIDFTVGGTMQWLEKCADLRLPMVIGATGHTEDELSRIRNGAATIPIVLAANFSVGVNLLLELVGDVARRLGDAYDIEIVEAHHRGKIDAPSGTASALLDRIAATTGRDAKSDAVFGRHGETGKRPSRQIGVHSLRMGDVVGKHEVHFSGPGETITLTHTAQSRHTFASGALRAAEWIVGKEPRLYSMHDVLA